MWKSIVCFLLQLIIISCGSGSPFLENSSVASYNSTNRNEVIYKTVLGKNPLSASTCECVGNGCGCCFHMDVPKLHLNDTACVNITYLPKDYGMTLTVNIDSWVLLNETISARSPPPLCFGEEYLPIGGDICLKFYDLDATLTSLHGCAQIYAKLKHIVLAKYDLGCFDIGHNSTVHLSSTMIRRVYIPNHFLP